MNTVVKQLESELSMIGSNMTGADPALDAMRRRIQADLDVAQQMVNEASTLNALNTKLGKIYQKNFKFLDDLYISGKMSKATGEIAKNADQEATFQRENVLFLNQRLQQLDKIKGRFRNEVAIFEIQQAINKAAKNSLAIQIQKVPLVEKELLASTKLLKAEQARTTVSKASLAVAKAQRKIDADNLEMQSKLNNQFGSLMTLNDVGLGQDGFGTPSRDDAAYSVKGALGVDNNDSGGTVVLIDEKERASIQKNVNILTKQGIELYKEQLDIETKLAAQMDTRRSLQREIVSIQQTGRNKQRQLSNTRAEASAAGAQASSAARVSKAENDTAKILARSILKREDIIKVELNLERIKMVEAKKQAGAQAALAKQKAVSDKQAITEQQDILMEQRGEDKRRAKIEKEFAERQETIRLAEVLLLQLRRDAEIKNLKAQEDLLFAQEGLQLAQAKVAKDTKDAEYQLIQDKYTLLRAQIVADRDNIAARVRLLNKTRPDALDVNADIIKDPSNQVLTTLDKAIKNIQDLRTAANSNYSATIQNIFDETDAKSDANKLAISNIRDEQEQTIALEKLRAGFFSQQQAEFDKIQDLETQKYVASFLNLELDKKLIDANLEKTLAAHGVEAASAQKLFDKAQENYEYLLSAAAKMKELVLGITNNINEGLSNAIQKLFENAATRGASLTDGIKEIGLGMYEDIRKTIVSQTIVTPAQDMMKGFIGDITGFDLDKKGIDEVILKDGKVPVTMGGGEEEDPIAKVKKDIEEKGESFFTGFKEKAKGAFDSIQTSLGDFGSKAMETFKGLGSGIKNLFTGENGILSGLGGMFKGLMGSEGGGGLFSSITGMLGMGAGGGGFNFGSLFGMAAGAPMATGGLVGVRSMAAGGQVNALRDRVPAMLEPGEFVMRKPAVKSIGAGNLGKMNATGAGGIGNVQFNIVNQGEPKEAEEQGQPKFEADKIVIDVVMKDLASNGPIRQAMRNG